MTEQKNQAVVYFGVKGEFSEKRSAYYLFNRKKRSKETFEIKIPSNVTEIRFDPIDEPCIVRNIKLILSTGKEILPAEHNGVQIDGDLYFSTSDPNILFDISQTRADHAMLFVDIHIFSEEDYVAAYDVMLQAVRYERKYSGSIRTHIKRDIKNRLFLRSDRNQASILRQVESVDDTDIFETPAIQAEEVYTLKKWLADRKQANGSSPANAIAKNDDSPKQSNDAYKDFDRIDYAEQFENTMQILKNASNVDLYFSHVLEGGSELYMQRRIEAAYIENRVAAVLRYVTGTRTYQLVISDARTQAKFDLNEVDDLRLVLDKLDRIILNQIVSFPDVEMLLEKITGFAQTYHTELEFLLHDYHCICPVFFLIDYERKYCDLPKTEICDICVRCNEYADYPIESIAQWRAQWQMFFQRCTRAIAFSTVSKMIFDRIFTLPIEMEIIPHQLPAWYPVKQIKQKQKNNRIVIATLGALTYPKGHGIITEMAKMSAKIAPQISFLVIGKSKPKIEIENVIETGPYRRDDIPVLAAKYGVDLFFIPSIWPETFSYTTKEAISIGLPVAAFNLGAHAEHVKKYEKGILIERVSSLEALDKIMAYFEN